MMCIITLKINDNEKSNIIYSSNSLGESVYMLEELAFCYLERKKGGNNKLLKSIPKERGFHAISYPNRIIIYEKFKDGWVFSGRLNKVYEFELICNRTNSLQDLQRKGKSIKCNCSFCVEETEFRRTEKKLRKECFEEMMREISIFDDTLNEFNEDKDEFN